MAAGHEKAEGIGEVLRCAWCFDIVDDDKQAYVVVRCSDEACGVTPYHTWCLDEYTEVRVRLYRGCTRAVRA